jgi:hypothetical protein
MPLLTMPAPVPAQSRRTLRTLLGCAAALAMVTVPCAVDFSAATLRGETAYARVGDGSGTGPSGGTVAEAVEAGSGTDPGDGGSGHGNGRVVGQNQNATQGAADPLERSGASLSPSQERDLINRGWPP